ncbi:alpha/beta hydrolase [Kitasatospora herbaricolor]|uniref:prolyl aminopeptidase n=1 Tax=Kitasatospora herbaricolor TaxID=68217 RepID=A0ABZ1WBU9_9ACTN|nr:alpha/beta hydrolase [Kitasatospora herbaricolor]
MLGTVLAASAAVLTAPVTGLLGHRALRRSRNVRLMRIDTPDGIDEQGYVRIGGIEQWLSVRGEDRHNPVLLELHGGPGAPTSIFGPRTRAWERHFTVVRWDMRGADRTLARAGADAAGGPTFDQVLADAVEVTRHLRVRLGVDRVVLVGSSYGSVLGLRLARSHPELYSAYVGTDQNIHDAGRDTSTHQAFLERLRAAGKHRELAAVEAMGPDQHRWTARQRATYAKLSATSDPMTLDTMRTVVIGSLWLSPLHSLRGIGSYFKGMKHSEPITEGTGHYDDWADGTDFDVPFFVLQGAQDVLTPPERARRFFDDVRAPVKGFALIEDAGHFAAFRHPDRFLELLLTLVRPAITRPTADLPAG